MVKYVDNFYEWVKQMIKEYQNSPDYIQFCAVADEKYSFLINHRTGKVTKAKCHEDDIFDEEVGLAIAWARYKGYEIPKERRIVYASKLKYGQHFYFMDKEGENVFIAKHPLKNTFIYSNLDGLVCVGWGKEVYIIQ